MKTSCFKRTLAILLSVLLATPLFVLSAFAEDFSLLPTATEDLNEGDLWYNVILLTNDTGSSTYRYASFYLSEDQNTLKIEYTTGDETTTEVYDRATDTQFFAYVTVMPAFGPALPTSSDGLADGDYWFDVEGYVTLFSGSTATRYRNASYYLSADGTLIRRVYDLYGMQMTSDEQVAVKSHNMPKFLRQAGVDPNAGFTLLPKSDEGLTDGAYWFDADGFAQAYGGGLVLFVNAEYYLSDDGNTIRVYLSASSSSEWTRENNAYAFAFLKQVGVDPNAGFTQIPTSAEGLEDGAWWFDSASLADVLGDSGAYFLSAEYYLSDDGNTLRMISNGNTTDYTKGDGGFGDALFNYLYQVGANPFEGFTQLPTSDEGLSDGDYWFDLESFLPMITDESTRQSFANAQYYLSDDGNTMRIFAGTTIDISRDDEDGAVLFGFLRQVGVDPDLIPGFTLLPKSDEGLSDGDYWYDAAGLAAVDGVEELQTQAKYYLSDDGNTIRLISPSLGQIDVARDSETGTYVFRYLRQVGVDPNVIAGFTLLPTSAEGLEDGDYWYDAADVADMLGDDDYLTYLYYLSDDGNTLRIILDNVNSVDISRTDEYADTYFGFLRQVGVDPYPGFTLLPKSAEGLADGDYWFDAAGFAAMANDDDYLRSEYLLSDDGNTLRINQKGYVFDVTKGSGGAGTYFVYLHKVGEVYTVLPTSEEGLEDGTYWFDAAGFAAMVEDDAYLTATYSLNAEAGILCIVLNGETSYYLNDMEYSYYFSFLKQAGVDPNEGFTALPTSAEGLAFGDWWYDAAALAALEGFTQEEIPEFLAALECYRSDDGAVLRLIFDGYVMDFDVDSEDDAEIVAFLHEVTTDPETGMTFVHLPISEEGLADGDLWFDAAGLNVLTADTFDQAEFYLSEDGTTMRVIFRGTQEEYAQNSEGGAILFMYLRTVGVDPNAGFILLPTSADGLNVGDLWFDAAGIAEAENDEEFLQYTYYISEDGNTIRVSIFGYPEDVTADSELGAEVFPFLKRVAGEPGTAYLTMTASAQTARSGDTVTMTVNLAQNPGLAGMTLSLSYDADVLMLTDVQAQGLLETGNLTLGGNLNFQPYNILWDDATSHENHTDTGTILTLTFTVKDTVQAGETTVTLTYDADSTFDVDLQNVPVIISGVTLMIETRISGDVDGDGEVDLADVATLTRYLAGGWNVTVNEENCDVNGDGEIDLKDVILIRRYLAGGWNVELI